MDRTDKQPERLRYSILICLLLAAVTLASYWPVLRNEFVNYDDPDYVSENPYVLRGLTWQSAAWAFQTAHVANWHPLTWLSHMLDIQLFGVQPFGHHLTSLLLHVANTLLLFLALQVMTRARWRSALVAALFALHPLHVESVAWVSERKDVLSGFFFMLTLWAYARYVECRMSNADPPSSDYGAASHPPSSDYGAASHPPSSDYGAASTHHAPRTTAASRSPLHASRSTLPASRSTLPASRSTLHASRYYGLALLFFALGLMSKAMLVTLPFLLLLLDYWPLRRAGMDYWINGLMDKWQSRAPSSPRELQPSAFSLQPFLEKLPFFALALASSVVTFVTQQNAGAVRTLEAFTPGFRLATALVAYMRYLGKTIWPAHLACIYPTPSEWPPLWVLGAAVLLVALTAFCIRQLQRAPYLAVGWFWFLGTLVPVIGIVQVGMQSMADRYTYIPLIGVFIAVVWGLAEWWGSGVLKSEARTPKPEGNPNPERRNPKPETDPGSRTTQHAPPSLRPTTARQAEDGTTHHAPPSLRPTTARQAEDGTTHHATPSLRPTTARQAEDGTTHHASPRHNEVTAGQRSTLNALGTLLAALALAACGLLTWTQAQCWRTTERLFTHAVAVTRDNEVAQNNLGLCLLRAGDVAGAEPHFLEAIRIRPELPDSLANLALCRYKQGRVPEAIDYFQRALAILPTPACHFDLATVLEKQGRLDEAEAHYRAALRQRPYFVEAWVNLGALKGAQGDAEAAVQAYTTALQLRPDYALAHSYLGQVLMVQRKWDEAIAHLRTGVDAAPQNAQGRFFLGAALASQHQYPGAAAQFAEACRLRPDYTEARESLGQALFFQGKLPEALPELKRALAAHPSAMNHHYLALTLHAQGQLGEALPHYREAACLDPDKPIYLNDLAWQLATHARAEVRDGAEAVKLAERACQLTEFKQPMLVGTLAAAYAEAGRFPEAVTTAEKAIALATAAGQTAVADKNRELLGLYRASRPYHESSGR